MEKNTIECMKNHIFEMRRKMQRHEWSYYTTNSYSDQLPFGFIAQLVEHCTDIVEVMGSNPVQAWSFSAFNFTAAQLSCVYNCDDHVFKLFSAI